VPGLERSAEQIICRRPSVWTWSWFGRVCVLSLIGRISEKLRMLKQASAVCNGSPARRLASESSTPVVAD
jgi:hypothetical protein